MREPASASAPLLASPSHSASSGSRPITSPWPVSNTPPSRQPRSSPPPPPSGPSSSAPARKQRNSPFANSSVSSPPLSVFSWFPTPTLPPRPSPPPTHIPPLPLPAETSP